MKLVKTLLLSSAVFASITCAHGQILLNDFSNWLAANPNGGFSSGTWNGEVTQNSGFITVGGTADNTGNAYLDFVGPVPKNLTGLTSLTLVARVDAGNASPGFTITITDSNGDSAASASFSAVDFSSSFGAATASWSVIDALKLQDANGFFIAGSGTSEAFRMSFDNLTAVPEPETWLLLALGLTLIVVFRRRQKA